jgi:nitrogenase molybdenum-iron protein alpha/beta subunit
MSYDLERPRGLLGYMLAFEGVSDAATIVHGPTGCKQYPADFSEKSFRTRDEKSVRDLFSFEEKYYFFQPRIPCTYLDGDTFVSGASERLQDLYSLVVSKKPGLIGVINSPGASLIGEDLTKLRSDIPTAVCESPGYSHSMSEGFQDGVIEIVRTLCKGPSSKKKGVCILGMGIWQHRWEDSLREIRRMLGLCGIEVTAAVCAGSSAEEIAKLPSSELNIVISEEFGKRVAEYCKESFGTDYVCGYPLGFDAVQDWILDVCERLLKDPAPALKDLEFWRHKTAGVVSRLDRSFIDISGRTFSIDGEGSLVEKATEFLYSYLGLIPVALTSSDKDKAAYVRSRFAMKGIPMTDSIWDEEADFCLASGNTISSLKSRGLVHDGVDICEPSRMHVTVTDEPLLGTMGTVILVQKVLDIVARIIR